jgi:UDP-2-acetamido-3-amino-2,3-dideoxy-glucuronate N-acetyltransferase
MSFFKHESSIVETPNIGNGTRIWAYVHVLAGASIGRECNICDHTFVENDVVIGDRVTVKSGVQIWDGVRIEDDVFIGPNATFTNDRFPRSGHHQDTPGVPRTVVRRGASVGANATILPGITVGECAMVGAGAVVTHDAPPYTVVAGNPARIIGYVGADSVPLEAERYIPPREIGPQPTSVQDVTFHRLPVVDDLRGQLTFGEMLSEIPFEVKRYFLVYGVSSQHIRGEHAHKTLHQFLICVHGSLHLVADDGERRQEFVLDSPSLGIHVPPMVWAVQYMYTPDAVLLALASDRYNAEDYIRDYAEFLRLRQARRNA